MGVKHPPGSPDGAAEREHRALLGLVDRYAAATAACAPLGQLIGLMEQLLAAARRHVEDEESEMRRAGYPQAPRHYAAHRHLLSSVANLLYSLRGARSPAESAASLKDWLARHLAGEDAAFYAWLDARG